MNSPLQSITVIFSPYHVGIHNHEVGAGPGRLREKGLLWDLRELGVTVTEAEVSPVYDDADGEIGRYFEVLRRTSKLVTEARNANSFPILISGNCGGTIGVLAGLAGSHALSEKRQQLGCIWFDAHDDFNTPDTMRGGYLDGMPVAIMAGQCWKELRNSIPGFEPLDLKRFVHCGLRDLNDIERERVTEAGYPVIWGDVPNVDYPGSLTKVLETRPIDPAMVHVDLDVLGATLGQVNKFKPAPGGMGGEDLVQCMEMIPKKTYPASLTIASYDPSFDDKGMVTGIAIPAITAFVHSLINSGVVARIK